MQGDIVVIHHHFRKKSTWWWYLSSSPCNQRFIDIGCLPVSMCSLNTGHLLGGRPGFAAAMRQRAYHFHNSRKQRRQRSADESRGSVGEWVGAEAAGWRVIWLSQGVNLRCYTMIGVNSWEYRVCLPCGRHAEGRSQMRTELWTCLRHSECACSSNLHLRLVTTLKIFLLPCSLHQQII